MAAIAAWIRDRLTAAGEDGISLRDVETDAQRHFKACRATVDRARTLLGDAVVAFRDPDDARGLVRLKLKEA
jgi:catechol 2,3-dioxygenase-like lactoylglutathione lyase family enzyme